MNKTQPDDSSEEMKTVGEIIKHFRLLGNMTQTDVSNAMGHRTPEWTGMIEAGNRQLDLDRAPQMAEILGINAEDFTKRVLLEQAPKAYGAIFACNEADHLELRQATRKAQSTMSAAALELAKHFTNLPHPVQESVLFHVMRLADVFRLGVRDRVSRRPLPRIKE